MFDIVVAKEGQKAILIAFLVMIVSILIGCGFLVTLAFIATIGLIFIFRNKDISYNNNDSDITSPISGVVTAIDVAEENKKDIYIDVSLCNNHILRACEDGDCTVEYKRGLNLLLNSFKAKRLNDKAIIKFNQTKINLCSSLFNTSINITKTQKLRKGEKIGVFLQGEVCVTVDSANDIMVKIGDKVDSGQTTLAIIPTPKEDEQKQED